MVVRRNRNDVPGYRGGRPHRFERGRYLVALWLPALEGGLRHASLCARRLAAQARRLVRVRSRSEATTADPGGAAAPSRLEPARSALLAARLDGVLRTPRREYRSRDLGYPGCPAVGRGSSSGRSLMACDQQRRAE